MKSSCLVARGAGVVICGVILLVMAGCHGEQEFEPLNTQKIYVSDKFFDVAVLDADRAIIVGYGGKILFTENFGSTWELIDSGTHATLYSIGFADDKHGWITGQEGTILRTEDGGSTWTKQNPGVFMTEECRDPGKREAIRVECREEKEAAAEILRSLKSSSRDPDRFSEERIREECGQKVREECPEAYLFAMDIIDADSAVAIGDRSVFIRTDDAGKTWNIVTLKASNTNVDSNWAIVFEDPVLYDVEFLDSNIGYVVGEFGKIYHTRNGGKTWLEQQETMMDDTVFDVMDLPTLFDVEFADRKTGIVVGLDGRIAVTNDGGKDWDFVPNNVSEYIDPFYSATILPDGKRWVVGSSGQVVIADAGGEFGQGSFGSAVNNWVRRIRFFDNSNGWVVGGFGFIMNTRDGGKTWFRRIG
ncbi:MAG: YCF48-related protein [Candidatus Binatia bacterium]